jgi:hypothetical protein
MLLDLTREEKRAYTMLHVSRGDFGSAAAYASFLIKKKWHHSPWERRGTIYLQQSAFTTAMVVSYGRPFGHSPKWERKLLALLNLTEHQLKAHRYLIELRNEVYAHSDTRRFSIRPWRAEDFETDIVGQPFLKISASDCHAVIDIGNTAMKLISHEMNGLREKFSSRTQKSK